MTVLSILKSYNPSLTIANGRVAEFDAEMDLSLVTRSDMTSYPIETGQQINDSIVLVPSKVDVTWAVGLKRIRSILSDPVSALSDEALGLAGGFLSNFIDSGSLRYLIGALADTALYQQDKDSRAFDAMNVLQESQLQAQPLNLIIEGLGVMKNVYVTQIRATRSGQHGGVVVFYISLTQPILLTASDNAEDGLRAQTYLGEIHGEKQ